MTTNNIKSIISNAPKFMLLVIALSLMVHEFYPFSHFPMYASFGPNTYYVFLADSNDRPIAIKKYFKFSTPKLKKMFNTRMKNIQKTGMIEMAKSEIVQEAARGLLMYIVEESDKDTIRPIKVLKLYVVDVALEEKVLTRKHTFIAEVEL